MILFHGTLEDNIKNISKNGILEYTKDQWLTEITQRNICCFSNQPTSGEGGNAAYFAYGFVKTKQQNGYLVVLDVPRAELQSKIVAIFDNKTLDDYVRFHFFVREEFRHIGYSMWEKMTEYRRKDRHFQKFGDVPQRRAAQDNELQKYTSDQRAYYKKLRDERYVYDFCGLVITDEIWDLLQFLGSWETVYDFLTLHFANWSTPYEQFHTNGSQNHAQFWRSFYTQHPLQIKEERLQHYRSWFAPTWLEQRQLKEPSENCQILCQKIEPQHIVGFIHITTPSGFAARFRNFRSKSSFVTEVWKEVHRLLDEQKK